MLKKNAMIIVVCTLLVACGGTPNLTETKNSNTNTISDTAVNIQKNEASNANNANVSTNTATSKPAESEPTRISFKKGEFGSSQNITLAPGATRKFIVSATGEQSLVITSTSKEVKFKTVKGTDGDFSRADFGEYMTATQGKKGEKVEAIFEAHNSTSKEIKSSFKVELLGGD